ncbi:lytic murein transglycosylase, partial [Vibrio mediterranei]|uniref:lytic murein transglycosylase n=1 Tax=Vibrio mediterranei TaxID=689 RepID=UPI00056F5855
MKRLLSVMLGASLATSAFAQEKGTFEEYVAGLKEEARQQGISEQILTEAFKGVEYKPRAVTADRNQPEKKLTLDEYIPRAVPDWKVKQAKKLHNKYYAELKRIGDEYGV